MNRKSDEGRRESAEGGVVAVQGREGNLLFGHQQGLVPPWRPWTRLRIPFLVLLPLLVLLAPLAQKLDVVLLLSQFLANRDVPQSSFAGKHASAGGALLLLHLLCQTQTTQLFPHFHPVTPRRLFSRFLLFYLFPFHSPLLASFWVFPSLCRRGIGPGRFDGCGLMILGNVSFYEKLGELSVAVGAEGVFGAAEMGSWSVGASGRDHGREGRTQFEVKLQFAWEEPALAVGTMFVLQLRQLLLNLVCLSLFRS